MSTHRVRCEDSEITTAVAVVKGGGKCTTLAFHGRSDILLILQDHFMPPPFKEWWKGHIVLPLSVRPSVSVRVRDSINNLRFSGGHPCPLDTFLVINNIANSQFSSHRVVQIDYVRGMEKSSDKV